MPQFRHVEGGVCFRCRGTRQDPHRSRVRGPKLSRAGRALVTQIVESGGSVVYVRAMQKPAREIYDAGLATYADGQLRITAVGRKSYQKAKAARS